MLVHRSYQSPRILLAGIHLGWAMHTPPAKTLSQSDWSETTWKLIPITIEPWDCEPYGREVLLGSLTLLLSRWAPLLNKGVSLAFLLCHVSPWTIHFRVLNFQGPTLRPWKGSSFLQQNLYLMWKGDTPPPWPISSSMPRPQDAQREFLSSIPTQHSDKSYHLSLSKYLIIYLYQNKMMDLIVTKQTL